MKLIEVVEKIPAAMKRLIIDLTSVSKRQFEQVKPRNMPESGIDERLIWYRAGTPMRSPGDQISSEAEYINVILKKSMKHGYLYLQVNTKGQHNKQVQAIVAKHRKLIANNPEDEIHKITGSAHFPDRTEGV